MTTYYPLQKLRKIPGLEHAKYVDPYEKTDLLLGLGNVGDIMRNNGRYMASEELIDS